MNWPLVALILLNIVGWALAFVLFCVARFWHAQAKYWEDLSERAMANAGRALAVGHDLKAMLEQQQSETLVEILESMPELPPDRQN